MRNEDKRSAGFTIIELLIATFIIGTVVTGLFGLFLLDLRGAQESERRVAAIALANERMEMVRNLPYLSVGTVGGWPAGAIPPAETVTRNSQAYSVQTDIRFVDDAFDGSTAGSTAGHERVIICHKPPGSAGQRTMEISGSALDAHLAHGDSTGACGTTGDGTNPGDEYNGDYKQVRIEVSWPSPSNARPVTLITYVASQGVEGGEQGGTLDFQALNAAGEGVEGAEVHITNPVLAPAIDISTQTNSEGRVVLPGLPPQADSYTLSVTMNGFTSEQTYARTASFVPDAGHSHLSMIVKKVADKTFYIDRTARLTITTRDESGQSLPNVPLTLTGTKTTGENIASDGTATPAYKVNETVTTGTGGSVNREGLEWDDYGLAVSGAATEYDIKETSLVLPLRLNPGDDTEVIATLVPHTDHSLQVTVVDAQRAPVNNATVSLSKDVFNAQLGTGVPGQVMFAGLPETGSYALAIEAPGFDPAAQAVNVQGTARVTVTMAAI